jgi:cytidylate kinase
MNRILRDIPVEGQVGKFVQQWESEHAERARKAVPLLGEGHKWSGSYIAISRELGSGGAEISRRVAEVLGWQHYDREIIEAIAARAQVREEIVARFDEQVQNEWQTYLYNVLTHQLLDNSRYLIQLTKVLVTIAQYGNAVILGRGANYLLPPEKGLRVRVVASMELRRKRLMQLRNYDEKTAAQAIAEQDRSRQEFLRHHFRCGDDEPCHYDVVLNTGNMPLAAATECIVRLATIKLGIPFSSQPFHALASSPAS